MIQMGTKLLVKDNSGAKIVKCIKVLGGSGKMSAGIGEEIVVAVREAIPTSKVKEGEVCYAVIVMTKSGIRRRDGSYLRFDENCVVLVNKQGEPVGTRVLCAIPRELRKEFMSLVSLAPEVL